jgi:hypothetical protein
MSEQIAEEAIVEPSKAVADSFNAELEKVGIDPTTGHEKIEQANDVTAIKPRPEPDAVVTDDGIPDMLLTGAPKKEPEVELWKGEPPQELKGKSREHFKNLQSQTGLKITSLETERERLAAEIAELKKNGNVAGEDTIKELEVLRKTREELEAELERVAVERSPMFKQKFLSRENQIKTQAIRVLKVSGADESLFEQAVNAPDKKKFELLNSEELNEAQRSALTSLLVQYDLIQDEKNSALENSKEFVKEHQTREEQRQKDQLAAREHAENEIFERMGKKVSTEFEPFMEVEGNEAWNEQVRANRERAKNFFAGKASLEELAEIAHYGIGAKSLHKMFRTVQGKYNAAVAEIAKLKGANPSINGSHPTKETPVNESSEERLKRTFREEMALVHNQG